MSARRLLLDALAAKLCEIEETGPDPWYALSTDDIVEQLAGIFDCIGFTDEGALGPDGEWRVPLFDEPIASFTLPMFRLRLRPESGDSGVSP